MNLSKEQLASILRVEQFPLSSKYGPEWLLENQMGPNALWLTEWLCRDMELKPGMRVLDMGCGKAMSSIFLAKEFGLQVWATDLWIKPTENWQRICEAGLQDRIFPIHAEAHSLPYAEDFFDAMVSVDTYHYFGTDDLYLEYFVRFVKAGGQIGIVVPGVMQELNGTIPDHLKSLWGHYPDQLFSFHTAEWWRRHWAQTRLVEVEIADTLKDGWRHWLDFNQALVASGACEEDDEIESLQADQGRYLGFVRMVARRLEARS